MSNNCSARLKICICKPTHTCSIIGRHVGLGQCDAHKWLQLNRQAKAHGIDVGRNTEKLTKEQMRWMAKLLSAVGFSSPKWIHLLKGTTGEPRETEKEEMPLNDDILDSIMRLLYIKRPAKSSTRVCGLTVNGGCTRSFVNKKDLAEHIFRTYREDWRDQVV